MSSIDHLEHEFELTFRARHLTVCGDVFSVNGLHYFVSRRDGIPLSDDMGDLFPGRRLRWGDWVCMEGDDIWCSSIAINQLRQLLNPQWVTENFLICDLYDMTWKVSGLIPSAGFRRKLNLRSPRQLELYLKKFHANCLCGYAEEPNNRGHLIFIIFDEEVNSFEFPRYQKIIEESVRKCKCVFITNYIPKQFQPQIRISTKIRCSKDDKSTHLIQQSHHPKALNPTFITQLI